MVVIPSRIKKRESYDREIKRERKERAWTWTSVQGRQAGISSCVKMIHGGERVVDAGCRWPLRSGRE